MPANTDPPARAEALSRTVPIRRLHPITVLVVVVGLLMTAAVVLGSWIVHDRNEHRLLDQRGHEAAHASRRRASAACRGRCPPPASRPKPARRRAVPDAHASTRRRGRFVSASVWPSAGRSAAFVVVGSAPALAGIRRRATRVPASCAAEDDQLPRPPRRRRPATRLRVREPGCADRHLRGGGVAEEPARPHRVGLRVRRPDYALYLGSADPVTPDRVELGPRAEGSGPRPSRSRSATPRSS